MGEGLSAITEAVELRRRLAESSLEVHRSELDRSLKALAWLSGDSTDPSRS
jgi:hypothetical protein